MVIVKIFKKNIIMNKFLGEFEETWIDDVDLLSHDLQIGDIVYGQRVVVYLDRWCNSSTVKGKIIWIGKFDNHDCLKLDKYSSLFFKVNGFSEIF